MKRQHYQKLVASHRNRIYSHALYSLRDALDAEDVTQETFLKLWCHYDTIGPDQMAGWLTRVAHNLCVDAARRRQTRRRNLGQADAAALADLPAAADGPGNPERGIYLDERQRQLLDALATLSPETRSVMVMHYFQDMPLAEIGDVLGKTVAALKVQIHRARKSLRLVLTGGPEITIAARRGTG